jgi:hypothetical protein
MARQSKLASGVSKVRFILLEAEGDSADLSDITQAIQGALGPRHIVQQRIISQDSPKQIEAIAQPFDEIELEEDADAPVEAPKKAPRATSQRRAFPTPEVVDVDWSSEVPLDEYVSLHPPKNTNERYLTVLSWFKQQKDQDSVSVNEVYTAFRKLKWPTAIKDFSQPLRDLKGQQLLTGGSKDGFRVNHLGISRVEEG